MKRKRYSASFKAKVALEAIRGLKTTNELAAEFGIHTTQIGHWKQRALESLPEVFTTNRSRSRDEDAALKDRLLRAKRVSPSGWTMILLIGSEAK